MRSFASAIASPASRAASRIMAIPGSSGPRALATRASRPCANASRAAFRARISAPASPATTAAASSGITAHPFSSAQRVCPSVTGETEPETASICSTGPATMVRCLAVRDPVARQCSTSAYSTPCEPAQKSGRAPQISAPFVAMSCIVIASSVTILAPSASRAKAAAGVGGEILDRDATEGQGRLAAEVDAHVGLVHRRDRVAAMTGWRSRRKTPSPAEAKRLPKSLVAAHRRGAATSTGTQGAARIARADARSPGRSSRLRGANRRSSRPCNGSPARRASRARRRRSAGARPSSPGAWRAADAGDADAADARGKRASRARRRRRRGTARTAARQSASDLHDRGGAGEVVAVECQEQAIRQFIGPTALSSAARAAPGASRRVLGQGCRAIAASQASRRLATPGRRARRDGP